VFQQFNLLKGISVLENVMLPAYPTGEDHREFALRAGELLEQFSIARHAASPVEWLSGGELQRVAIARALINDPAVIIADEPTRIWIPRSPGSSWRSWAPSKKRARPS
jgi:putative ABC transport system ATP-binding protein